MANVFRQFLLDAENGDIDAVKRNIEHGIGLETRDEVRRKQKKKKRISVMLLFRINKQPLFYLLDVTIWNA
jgi:hypothetical protein